MKKSIVYLILFFIILVVYELGFNYLKSDHDINYILTTEENEYKVNESFVRDSSQNTYFVKLEDKENVSYVFGVENRFNKRKNIVKEINEYKKDGYKCINLLLMDDTFSETICNKDGNLYSYYYLKDELHIEDLDHFLESYDTKNDDFITYDNLNVRRAFMEDKEYLIFHLPKRMVIFHDGDQDSFSFSTYDNYKNTHGYLVDKFYVIPRLTNAPELYDYLIYDLLKNKVENLTLGTTISTNSYYNGDYNGELYITDRTNLRQYKLNPGAKKVELISTVQEKAYIYNYGVEDRVSIYTLVDKDIKFNTTSEKYNNNKYDQIFEATSYAYYVKDDTFYKVYEKFPDVKILQFKSNEPHNIVLRNNTLYYIEYNQLKKYNNKGINVLLEYDELINNYENVFDVYYDN